ncbi:MAG: acyl-CoA thioesterase [Planctomycetota bacterium]
MAERVSKAPADSIVEMREIVLPNDTNTHGAILGGRVLHLMDIAAAMAAMRHARKPVVTAAMDHVEFLHPIPLGHFVFLKASVNYAGRTSMEIGVKVLSENPVTGELSHTSSAYLTFVALAPDGRPAEIPAVDPQTPDERRRFAEGRERMERRRERRRRG